MLDMPEPPLALDRRFLSSLSQDRDVSGNSRFLGSLAPTSELWAAEPKLARVGPTTPTRRPGLPLGPMAVGSAFILPHLVRC
jgi:hypothetical protein